MQGQAVVVGVGESKYYKAWQGAGVRVPAGVRGDPQRGRRCRSRVERSRRVGFLHGPPQQPPAAGGGAGLRGLALVGHAVGRRRQQLLRHHAPGRRRCLGRSRQLRGRLPGTRPGPVPASRLRRGSALGRRTRGSLVGPSARADDAGPGVRAPDQPLDARPRGRAGGARRDLVGLLCERSAQSAGRTVWASADAGAVSRLALDRGALPPLRLLHGERRRGGADRHHPRAREGPAGQGGADPRDRAVEGTGDRAHRRSSSAGSPACTTRVSGGSCGSGPA